jgi:hypothetical protein
MLTCEAFSRNKAARIIRHKRPSHDGLVVGLVSLEQHATFDQNGEWSGRGADPVCAIQRSARDPCCIHAKIWVFREAFLEAPR